MIFTKMYFYPILVQRTWDLSRQKVAGEAVLPKFSLFFSQDHLEGTSLEMMIINLFFVMFKI